MKLQEQDSYWVKRQLIALQTAINERYGTNIVLLLKEMDGNVLHSDEVISIASEVLGVSVKKLAGRSKKTDVTFARYICYLLLKEYTAVQHPLKIAELFNRNRTSVIIGIRTGKNLLETQEHRFVKMYNHVKTELQAKSSPVFS